MKKHQIMGIAMVAGMLSFGALSASAADSFGDSSDKQALQQFIRETAALTRVLKAKEIELRDQNACTVSEVNSTPSSDFGKISTLESEIKELNDKIAAVAQKYGVPAYYCHS